MTEKDLAEVVALLEQDGAEAYTLRQAEKLTSDARDALNARGSPCG